MKMISNANDGASERLDDANCDDAFAQEVRQFMAGSIKCDPLNHETGSPRIEALAETGESFCLICFFVLAYGAGFNDCQATESLREVQ